MELPGTQYLSPAMPLLSQGCGGGGGGGGGVGGWGANDRCIIWFHDLDFMVPCSRLWWDLSCQISTKRLCAYQQVGILLSSLYKTLNTMKN